MKLSEFIEKYGDCEVTEEMLDMVNPKRDWKPKLKEPYYCITGVGLISSNNFKNKDQDNFRIAKRNVYQTNEEAQFALDMYKFCKERSFEPDWDNGNQNKHLLILDNSRNTCEVSSCFVTNRFAPFYYPTIDAVQEVIDKYSFEDLAKYYGRV